MTQTIIKSKMSEFFTTESEGAYNLLSGATARPFYHRFFNSETGKLNFLYSGAAFPIVAETAGDSAPTGNFKSADGYHPTAIGGVVFSTRPAVVKRGAWHLNGHDGSNYQVISVGTEGAKLRTNAHLFNIQTDVVKDCVSPKITGEFYLTFFVTPLAQTNEGILTTAPTISHESFRLAVYAATNGWPGWFYSGYASVSTFGPVPGMALAGSRAKYDMTSKMGAPLVLFNDRPLAKVKGVMFDSSAFVGDVSPMPHIVMGQNIAALNMALISCTMQHVRELSFESKVISKKHVDTDAGKAFYAFKRYLSECPSIDRFAAPGLMTTVNWDQVIQVLQDYVASKEAEFRSQPNIMIAIRNSLPGMLKQPIAALQGQPVTAVAGAHSVINGLMAIFQAAKVDPTLDPQPIRDYSSRLGDSLRPQGLVRDANRQTDPYTATVNIQSKPKERVMSEDAVDSANKARQAMMDRIKMARHMQQVRYSDAPPVQSTALSGPVNAETDDEAFMSAEESEEPKPQRGYLKAIASMPIVRTLTGRNADAVNDDQSSNKENATKKKKTRSRSSNKKVNV